MKKTILSMFAAAAMAASATAAAACPDWTGQPHFGQIQLTAGFTPDPYVRNITAGGTVDLASCGLNASGYVTTRPDFDLYWDGNATSLTIAVESNADGVLLISAPDGTWHYNDDYRGTNPAVTFNNPQPGLYDIWIGTYDGSRRNPGRLIITELGY
ncbi:peptidase S1 and S6, chymotrypsin/Hap [Ketogulonicigenium robustum]|uniref:Peptidase S1 and S6, chymotrypsin/Hap n=1 Tax=Ketogulonicigenium robustum TaxID=92947 RepID=A0A1W6NZH8_9RHOB|nr:peptidase S1 [Ketogulonicigenium robustum]ARO14655.1 peptidase S1 and S6, chymotrypsin/Hap [Ketogulonicigenium robustum]